MGQGKSMPKTSRATVEAGITASRVEGAPSTKLELVESWSR